MYKEEKFFIISFNITNSQYLKKIKNAWRKQTLLSSAVGRHDDDETISITSDVLGGEVALMALNDKLDMGVIKRIKVCTPMGMCLSKNGDALYTGSDHWMYKIKEGKIINKLDNDLFNCVHGIYKTKKNTIYVTSTGIDSILEIYPNNPSKQIWSWFATENGYPISKNGEIRSLNYCNKLQGIEFCTPKHTTHINSAIESGKNKILATLFHQGELIEINKSTKKTTVLLSGLRNPHGIKKTNKQYLVSDTRGNRVIIMNKDYKISNIIQNNFDWVQDAIFVSDGNVLVADSNNGRIVHWDKENQLCSEVYSYNADQRRIGSIIEVSKKSAECIFNIPRKSL